MRPIYFNGKFYAGGMSGVRRVADRLIREVDARLAELPATERPQATLFLPRRRQWEPTLTTIRVVEESRGDSQFWEQLVLPIRARGGLLVNLCNLAPVLHAEKMLMLHDVQFLFPDSSYPARLRWGYRLMTPWMARTSRQVLTVSAYSRQMLDLCGVSARDRTQVLHNGADHILDAPADPDVIARLGLEPGRFVVHLASPKLYKNTAVILQAFADPRLADLDLVLVGPDRAKLSSGGLKAPEGVIFAGAIDDPGLRALYEGALCLASPSRTEGFGLPPIEAMACGCPAVVSAGGAIPEICRDAVLYADVDRPESWVEAFRSLADSPRARAAKVRAGRCRAGEFTWEASGRTLTDALLRRCGV
jgi:glycosyltransferase involved in cell wall biosynthesis